MTFTFPKSPDKTVPIREMVGSFAVGCIAGKLPHIAVAIAEIIGAETCPLVIPESSYQQC